MSVAVDRCDVVVVGAGLAGLCAATRLVRAGLDVIVLEARDRVGGRTHTESWASGARVDLGAQWVGPRHSALLALADELGCATFPTYDDGMSLEYAGGAMHRFAGDLPDADPAVTQDLIDALTAIEVLAATVDLVQPWLSPGAEELDRITFHSWLEQHVETAGARERLATVTRAVWAVEPGDISLLHLLFYTRSNGGLTQLTSTTGGAQELRFVDGAQSVSLGLAQQLGSRVRLNSPVWSIRHDADAVIAGGPDRSVTARHAVIAIPPTLAGQVRYEPPMPPRRAQLTQRTPMGTVIKVFCSYPAPFWRSDGVSGQVLSDTGPVRVVFDDSPPDGQVGVLVGFIEGAEARDWMERDSAARRAAVVGNLVTYFGPAAAEPAEYRDKTWAGEQYSGGCYAAFLPPGVWTSYGSAVRAPVGRLHWAGSDFAVHSAGYMDGAVRSGHDAADAVIDVRRHE